MDTASIDRDIREFLVKTFLFGRAEALGQQESLLGSIIDSTGTIELVLFLEEHFQITVSDEDVTPENFGSINTVVAYVAQKLEKTTAAHAN